VAVDSPAKIALIGAGPIGLEAALYARFLGYNVEVYERGGVAENVRRWGHVRMFTPFHMNRSTLGIAAILAQDPNYHLPTDDAILTGSEWYDRYLHPLSQTDLLIDHIHTQTDVVAVARKEFCKTDWPGDERRGESDFRLLLGHQDRSETDATAEVLIDTSGVFGNPNWMGQGGAPARGERALRNEIEYGVPDLSGRDRERYAGQHTLVVGGGHSAATTIVALAKLTEEETNTRLTWIVRHPSGESSESGPIRQISDDRLPERAELASSANAVAAGNSTVIAFWAGTSIESIEQEDGIFRVKYQGLHEGVSQFDRIVANVGGRPDLRLFEELQVHNCYVTDGPIKLAAMLLDSTTSDCLAQTTHGPQTLINPEPDFYVLGAKSYGRNTSFLTSIGIQQVRELFTIIGDREDLDLYATATSLIPSQPPSS
jgi:thioredoxin reductase